MNFLKTKSDLVTHSIWTTMYPTNYNQLVLTMILIIKTEESENGGFKADRNEHYHIVDGDRSLLEMFLHTLMWFFAFVSGTNKSRHEVIFKSMFGNWLLSSQLNIIMLIEKQIVLACNTHYLTNVKVSANLTVITIFTIIVIWFTLANCAHFEIYISCIFQ